MAQCHSLKLFFEKYPFPDLCGDCILTSLPGCSLLKREIQKLLKRITRYFVLGYVAMLLDWYQGKGQWTQCPLDRLLSRGCGSGLCLGGCLAGHHQKSDLTIGQVFVELLKVSWQMVVLMNAIMSNQNNFCTLPSC